MLTAEKEALARISTAASAVTFSAIWAKISPEIDDRLRNGLAKDLNALSTAVEDYRVFLLPSCEICGGKACGENCGNEEGVA